ncbi:MAG: hypothetical protein HKN32_07280 [Flavobacteriales bacterium]|nr:hypothetical protein [Flavobacteriales bacterium]
MKKFLVLYHAPDASFKQNENATPEDMQKGMEAWMQWAGRCGDKLVDMGSPLRNGLHINPAGSQPSKKEVAGFSVLQAEDIEGAKALLKDHPHLQWGAGCDIEVHEYQPMPGS